ncbi:MAG: Holliday junction resolvase RuvX [Actinomycetota bacterium]|nr:Holliday junction resolvase RuvX [Actinomycetota bacterium]
MGGDGTRGRALGLDLGERRIGVALSDSSRLLATPYAVVDRSGDRGRDREQIAALVAEAGATVVVVGIPLGLDGRVGAAARGALAEIEEIRAVVGVPVETADERLTTVEAERRRSDVALEVGREGRGGRGERRTSPHGAARSRVRRVVDDAAAAVMLQSWIDSSAGDR